MMDHEAALRLDETMRQALWKQVTEVIEGYLTSQDAISISPTLDPDQVRSYLSQVDFDRPIPPAEALEFVARGLDRYQMHTAHPRYFGLFNPTPATMSIAADALAAAFNPQMAAWGHNPFGVEVERFLIRALALKFGYDEASADGTFASGGAEANHTALLTSLVHTFPEYAEVGLRGIDRQPVLYVSNESHHSLIKAARSCGLGTDAIRRVPVDEGLKINVEALAAGVARDRSAGLAPFLAVATAGTTSAGVIDPLPEMADLAQGEGLWLHVDAAWGGAAALAPELRAHLKGIERADSITFDAHKWLNVPMAAGLFLTRHPEVLAQAFRITAAYIPKDTHGLEVIDPYTHSIQWSRRFIGLKVYLALAVAGWEGYRRAILHQTAMGELLRQELEAEGWEVANRTPLPVVCFVDGSSPAGRSEAFIEAVAQEVASGGENWISVTRLDEVQPVLRACITSYRTKPADLEWLLRDLRRARRKVYAEN